MTATGANLAAQICLPTRSAYRTNAAGQDALDILHGPTQHASTYFF